MIIITLEELTHLLIILCVFIEMQIAMTITLLLLKKYGTKRYGKKQDISLGDSE